MLEYDAGFDHQLTKQQNDASELMELQSSLSREIENEILQMNDSKFIVNENDSEIAANAAVNELERIGSVDNISLAGDLVEPNETMTTSAKPNSTIKRPKSKSPTKQRKGSNKDVVPIETIVKVKTKKTVEFDDVIVRREKNVTFKSPNGEKRAKNSEQKTLKVNGSPRNHQVIDIGKLVKYSNEKLKNFDSQISAMKKETDEPQSNAAATTTSTATTATDTKAACEYCCESFGTKLSMVNHIKDKHNDLIFHCEMCDDYVSRADLISHMLNHALGSASTSKETMTNDTPAPATAATAATTTTPETMTTPPTTAAGVSNGPNKVTKRTNKSTAHNDSSSKENHLPKSKRSTHCADCNKTFADYGGLRYHIDHFHKKIKNYECDICGTFFSCKRIITNHIRGVHLKNVEKMYQCGLCQKRFSTDSALYIHKQSHETVYKFTCHVCDRKFRSQCKLKIHMTMHTKEKNFFCEQCNRGFAVRNNLTKHMLTHSKSFDFKCDKCSYMANQKRYLFQHKKRNHKE